MIVGQKMKWSRQPGHAQQIYYDVFHCQKNSMVDSLHTPLIDVYKCLGLSDEFSKELGYSCSLGNLNVEQSKSCIAEMRGNGHIREKHSDLTGGDCQRMLHQKCELEVAVAGITSTWSVLRPMAKAAMDLQGTEGSRDDAEVCFKLFHKMFDLFSKASELRLTIHLWGDHSAEHRRLVKEFYTCLATEVNDELVDGMKAGLTYITWPSHYIAEHLSDEMAAWAAFTGGIPFGRSSNQVSEHMNKIIKRYLKRHTSSGVDGVDIRGSKFRQLLIRLGAERLRCSEIEMPQIRKAKPCGHCLKRGIALTSAAMHYRRTSRKCNPEDRVARVKSAMGRALGLSLDDDSGDDSRGESDSKGPGPDSE